MLHKRLIALRKKKKLTQNELAQKLGITRSALSQYELGNRHPDYETLQKIAEFFDCSTDYLLGRTDDPTPPGVNTAFYDLEGLTDEQKELIHKQIEIFRKLKAESQGKE